MWTLDSCRECSMAQRSSLACTYIYIYILYVYTNTRAHTHTHAHRRTHTHTHKTQHTHAHTHSHTQSPPPPPPLPHSRTHTHNITRIARGRSLALLTSPESLPAAPSAVLSPISERDTSPAPIPWAGTSFFLWERFEVSFSCVWCVCVCVGGGGCVSRVRYLRPVDTVVAEDL